MKFFKNLLQSPESKVEFWLIFILTPLAAVTGAYITNNLILGILIGYAWGILQSGGQRMIINFINLYKDMKILSPVRNFLKDPADREGIIVSHTQYKDILKSLAKKANKKLDAICTIGPSEFMSDAKGQYRKVQEDKSKRLREKKRVLVHPKDPLKTDPKLKEFVEWHLNTVMFELYWIDKQPFETKQQQFSPGRDFPFEKPEDLVMFDKWLINGNLESMGFRINYCDIQNNLMRCQEFFDDLLTYNIKSYDEFKSKLEHDC